MAIVRSDARTRQIIGMAIEVSKRNGWPFELFGAVEQQPGWIHFEVERRLLALDDGGLRRAVGRLRADGFKTEPAFAVVLGISGDPYRGLLALAAETDAALRARVAACDLG